MYPKKTLKATCTRKKFIKLKNSLKINPKLLTTTALIRFQRANSKYQVSTSKLNLNLLNDKRKTHVSN